MGTTSAPTGINSTDELFDPVGKRCSIQDQDKERSADTDVARGFFRPQRLPNDTVSTILNMCPQNPRLGCPYNTGTAKFSSGSLDKMACSIFGDIVQIAPARMIAQSLARDGVPVYKYRFNHLPSNTSELEKGITTGVEQAYVFSNNIADQPWDQNLAYQMSASWITFVHDLDPSQGNNGENLVGLRDSSILLTGGHRTWSARLAFIYRGSRRHGVQWLRLHCRAGHVSIGCYPIYHGERFAGWGGLMWDF